MDICVQVERLSWGLGKNPDGRSKSIASPPRTWSKEATARPHSLKAFERFPWPLKSSTHCHWTSAIFAHWRSNTSKTNIRYLKTTTILGRGNTNYQKHQSPLKTFRWLGPGRLQWTPAGNVEMEEWVSEGGNPKALTLGAPICTKGIKSDSAGSGIARFQQR